MKIRQPPLKLKEVKIEVTHRCKLKCLHCSSESSSNSLEMSEEQCRRIVTQAIEMGVEEIALSGGEPLLWHSLENVIKATAKEDLRISIYSSGNVPNVE